MIDQIATTPPLGFRVEQRDALRVLGRLRLLEGDDAKRKLSAAIRGRKAYLGVPRQTVSTVHRAKGLAFDRVMIVHCGAASFPANDYGRKLLYVALSRARRKVILVGPKDSMSPLLDDRPG